MELMCNLYPVISPELELVLMLPEVVMLVPNKMVSVLMVMCFASFAKSILKSQTHGLICKYEIEIFEKQSKLFKLGDDLSAFL